MNAVVLTFVSVLLVILALWLVASAVKRKKARFVHDKLDKEYVYRKEPSADQVAQLPNKLTNNKITKG